MASFGVDCFLPLPLFLNLDLKSGSSSVGRASAFQAECRGFESRLPLFDQ